MSQPAHERLKVETRQGRFHRHGLIEWWDQQRLAGATALVLGAGALGNEIIKNLCLLGFGRIRIVDLDTVENSNLSRSPLFRERHEGVPKALAAAVDDPDATNDPDDDPAPDRRGLPDPSTGDPS